MAHGNITFLKRWIASGAKGTSAPRELERLEIEPKEVLFSSNVEQIQLRVVAVWQDSSREDVTPLCRFRTNDDSVVTVESDGQLNSIGPGDSHIIAFYDNGVASVPVMRAFSYLAEADLSNAGYDHEDRRDGAGQVA